MFSHFHSTYSASWTEITVGKVYFNSPLHVSSCGVSSSSSCLACGLAGDCSPGLKAVAGDCSCRTPGSDHWGPWRVSSCAGALPGSLCHPGGLIPCSSTKEAAEDKADEGHLSHFPILMCHEQHWGVNFAHTEHLNNGVHKSRRSCFRHCSMIIWYVMFRIYDDPKSLNLFNFRSLQCCIKTPTVNSEVWGSAVDCVMVIYCFMRKLNFGTTWWDERPNEFKS